MSRFSTLRNLILAAGLLFVGSAAYATDIAYTGTFQGTEGPATGTGIAAAKTYTRDMNTTGDRVSFQITYSSYSAPASKTFTDGSASTGSFTVTTNSFVLASTPTISINGVNIVYVPVATSTGTAKAISDAIVANSGLNTIISSTWTGTTTGVVTTTATSVGTATNYAMTSSSSAALTPSGATMTGGTNSAYLINTPTITIASNGFTTGLQVLYSKASGQDISGLTDQTTYYVSLVSPNSIGTANAFKLSSSLANAQAGTGIVLASSAVKTTADTFTLAPLAFANTSGGGIQLQWSDDNSHWTNITTGNYGLAITSVTFVSAGATSLYDLGPIQHRYLRASEAPPTTGAITYTCTDNERYSFKH